MGIDLRRVHPTTVSDESFRNDARRAAHRMCVYARLPRVSAHMSARVSARMSARVAAHFVMPQVAENQVVLQKNGVLQSTILFATASVKPFSSSFFPALSRESATADAKGFPICDSTRHARLNTEV